MKRMVSLLLALLLMVSLAACGGGETTPPAEEDPAKTEAPAEPTAAPLEQVSCGDTISLDFVEIKLGSEVNWATEIKEKTNSNTSYTTSAQQPGTVLFWLPAVLKNLNGESYDIWANGHSMVKVIFDGKYTYEGDLYSLITNTMDPLLEKNIYIRAEVPQEVAETYQTVSIQFAFDENFAVPDDWYERELEDYTYCYEVQIGGSAEPAGETVDAETIDAALQGSWALQDSNVFTFANGKVSVASNGKKMLDGTYEIDAAGSKVVGDFQATDGKVAINLPYEYADGALTLYNNEGQALEKQG